ncbi:MAG: helicase-exonuclease AddAB subunit AddB [Clostridia bacterium]|nr:helicase-exonuclease AddAB subunit AddB [Clostridia bacterium]
MGLKIVYGKAGSGKSEYCFSEIANLIKKEKKIYMITPEQFSFTAEKKLMKAIGNKAVINAEVITLSRMAYRVMQELGGNKKTKLTKCGKAMLIYSILNTNKNKLKFLNKSDENIDLTLTAITEFKKHGILPEHLIEEEQKIEDIYLKTKLNDMSLIYKDFENKLQEGYIEDHDLLNILSNKIEETDILTNAIIYLDEFSGFTKQEYEVLKKMVKLAKQVTITINADTLEPSVNPDTDIFYSNKTIISKLQSTLKEDFKLEDTVHLSKQYRFKTEELKHIEKNIFNTKLQQYSLEPKKVSLFLAKNQYAEIENVAKQITKLVRDEKTRYKDIAVITRNIDTYSSLVRSIFEEYKIPVFIDEKRDLNQNMIVQYILSIFEIFSSNFSREAVFNYLKIGFVNLEEDDIFKLENYCIKWGIKQNKWKNDFKFGKNEKTKEEIEYLNNLRKIIIEPLYELKKRMKDAETISKSIYQFMQENKIEEKINSKISELQALGQIDLANEYVASYKIILNILDEIVLIFKNEKITIDKYRQILKIGLKNSELGKIPGTQDQVIVGDVERSRSHKVDTIFIIGLNDGSFPSINKAEGFFGDKDREILKEDGIELANGTIDNLYEENFNIYKVFSTAEKRLYLSYASSDFEGKSLRPSMLVSKIKKMFPKLKEQSDVIQKNYEITNIEKTYQELLENISKLQENKEINNIWYTIFEYYKGKDNWYKKLKKDLKGIDYTNIPKNIKPEIIEKLYGNTITTSVSKLEKFAGCPFSYYLQYGLRLQEKEELKVQSFDTGSFMHEMIDEFFKRVKQENIILAELVSDEEKIQDIVNKVLKEKLDMGKNYNFVATSKYKVLVKRLNRIVVKALKFIIEGLVYSDFNIEGTEIEFGQKGKYKPIEITLENGKKIEIIGKIDRVDTANSEDGNYLRIIDYKSSAKNIDLNEVYAGLQIQLLTYIDAVCKEEDLIPAGVLYFSLLEQIIKTDKKMSEEKIEEELRKQFKMKGLILADIKVIKLHDKNLKSGTSKLIPATITKSGEISESKTNGVKEQEFKILQDYIYKTIKEISKEILKGNISIKPYYKKGNTPCKYCSYKSICGFNPKICGNNYNYIDNKSKDDIILKMKEKL